MGKKNKGAIMGPILAEFGIKKIDDRQLLAGLEKKFGSEGRRIYQQFDEFSPAGITEEELEQRLKAKDDPFNQTELYDFENASLDAGMLFTAYADADVISSFSQWLYNNQSFLGKNILEVGCGNGILTAFLARLCPQAHITAVDRSANSIAVAQQVKARLKLENVDFLVCDVKDLPAAAYDTVISLRTLHENTQPLWTPFRFLPFSQQLELFRTLYHAHISCLCPFVAEGGHLLAIERVTPGIPLLACLQEMNDGSLFPASPVGEVHARETNLMEPTAFASLVLTKSETRSAENVFCFWSGPLFGDPEDPRFWPEEQVDYELEQMQETLLAGYASYTPEGMQCAQSSIHSIKNDPGHFLLLQANLETKRLGYFSNSRQSEVLALLEHQKLRDRQSGCQIRDLHS